MPSNINLIKPVLAVGGPTAGGKSALAVRLSKDLSGEVVSVDSVQVYRHFNIGSAKISEEEMGGVPHHLLSIKEPTDIFNAAEFRSLAAKSIADIQARNRLPVVCAGTGLYLTTLLHGIADAPKRDDKLRSELDALSSDELISKIRQLDPVYAERVHANDRLRIIRAIETFLSSGKAYSEIVEEHGYGEVMLPALIVVLCRRRAELYRAIDERASAMVRAGIVGETKEILARYGEDCPALGTIGYHEALAHIRGGLGEAELSAAIAQSTRRLAKRQMTYWRNEPKKRGWAVRPAGEEGRELEVEQSPRRRPPVKTFRVFDLDYAELAARVKSRLSELKNGVELWYVHADRLCDI